MNWYWQSLAAAIGFAIELICFQRLQKSYPIDVYLFYTRLGIAVFFLVTLVGVDLSLTVDLVIILIFIGVVNWYGNYTLNVAISKQTNLGYVEAVSSVRVVLLYLASLAFLRSDIELVKLLACFGVIAGVVVVRSAQASNGKHSDRNWYVWCLIAGTMLAMMAFGNRLVNDRGINPPTALAIWLAPSTALYGISVIVKGQNLQVKPSTIPTLAISILSAIIGSLGLFGAYSSAPNLAYPTVINSSRMILLYIVSVVMTSEKVRIRNLLGIALTLFCVILLSR